MEIKRSLKKLLWALFAFFLVYLFIGGIAFLVTRPPHVFAKNAIGIIEISGTIIDAQESLKQMREFKEAEGIKGVVIRIDSPGGAVGASQELFEGIEALAKEKPVVASLGSVAASGGYYAACAAPFIFANPGTITGSIGVRIDHVELGELLDWAKINYETLKSGKNKSMLSFHKPLESAEREIIENLLSQIHDQFKKDVASSRNLALEKLEEYADGRILTGVQAKELGLIDRLGGLTQAIEKIKDQLDLENPKIIYASGSSSWLSKVMEARQEVAQLFEGSRLKFLYQL